MGDMATAEAGYYAYVQDAWRWPLFQTEGLGSHGVNVVFTDSVPIVALLGRFLFLATGKIIPLYGLWSGSCVAGMALAFTGLVRALGARSPVAALAAAIIGVSMPAFLARWGHIALMAQALIPLALTVYVQITRAANLHAARVFGCCLALCLGSLLVTPYFFVMVAGIVAAAILQAGTDRRLPRLHAAGVLAALAGVTGCVMVAMGFGGPAVAASDEGFGFFSTNLLSLFVPYSGSLPDGSTYIVDATGGQYEGMAFIGPGVLILAMLARRSIVPGLTGAWRRHPWLLAAVATLMAAALSNEVYLGNLHLLSVPLPPALSWAGGVFRSSGRFAWVPMYLLAAMAIAAASRRPDAILILVLAAGVQFARAEPLIQAIQHSVAARPSSVLDQTAWQAVLPGADRLVLVPTFACMPNGPWQPRRMAAIELELLAARAGVPTNTVYAARTARNCSMPPLTPRSIIVYLDDSPPPAGFSCATRPLGTVCSAALDDRALASLLPAGEVQFRP